MKNQFYYINSKKIINGCCVFSLLFFFIAVNKLNAQESDKSNSQVSFKEKLFVHTDKNFYVAGEIIWFKIYACNAFDNKPDSISKIAYVEILSPDNKPVLQAKIQLEDGSGNGSLQLPTSLNSGNYIFRAYTNWMKNFSADAQFYSTISIVNTFKAAQFEITGDTAKYDIQLFPESGNLISGLENKVAFKITDEYGNSINSTGYLLNENNDTITSFSAFKFGMGNFNFTPAADKHYRAVISIKNSIFIKSLPEQQKGYLLHLENDNGSTLLVFARTNINSQDNIAYLLIQNKHATSSTHILNFQNGQASLNVNKTLLAEGITTFTLFDANHQPVCERLYFKRPKQLFDINASSDKSVYSKRDKVTFTAAAVNGQQTNASMSVYLVDSLQKGINSINTYLWLSSELKGFIESPEYYLTSNDKDVATATDNLMLTQGWRKFIKKDSTPVNQFDYIPEYEGHIITGKISNKKNGEPVSGIPVYLSVPAKNFRMAVSVSDQQGILRFNVPAFIGSDEIVVQTNQTIDSIYRIDIFNPFSDKYPGINKYPLFINENLQKQILSHSISSQVLNNYYNDQQNHFFTNYTDTFPFFGKPDREYFLDDYTRFTTMEEVLREYVPDVAPRKHRNNFRLKVNDKGAIPFDENPLVLMDGVPFFNMDTVISFDPLKIKSLSVVEKKYYYGPLTFYGIMSYVTYKGDLDGINLDPNSLVMEYNGMQLQRQFYSPIYETEEQRKSPMPDFRNTLYWLPDLRLNMDEKKQISFYTGDIAGKYLIVLNGLTSDGKAATIALTFQVQ